MVGLPLVPGIAWGAVASPRRPCGPAWHNGDWLVSRPEHPAPLREHRLPGAASGPPWGLQVVTLLPFSCFLGRVPRNLYLPTWYVSAHLRCLEVSQITPGAHLQATKSCPRHVLLSRQGELPKRLYLPVSVDFDGNNFTGKTKLTDPRDLNAFVFVIWYNKWAHINCSPDMLGEHCAACVQIWAVSCSDFSLFVFSFCKLAYFPVKSDHLKYFKCLSSAVWVTGEQGSFCHWTQSWVLGASWWRHP